jgi:hypothetical protein
MKRCACAAYACPNPPARVFQILDQAGLIERNEERKRSPLPLQEPL